MSIRFGKPEGKYHMYMYLPDSGYIQITYPTKDSWALPKSKVDFQW